MVDGPLPSSAPESIATAFRTSQAPARSQGVFGGPNGLAGVHLYGRMVCPPVLSQAAAQQAAPPAAQAPPAQQQGQIVQKQQARQAQHQQQPAKAKKAKSASHANGGITPLSTREAEQELAQKRQRLDRLAPSLSDGGAAHWKLVARYERYIVLLRQKEQQTQRVKEESERRRQELAQQQGQGAAKRHKPLHNSGSQQQQKQPPSLATHCKLCFQPPAPGKQLKRAQFKDNGEEIAVCFDCLQKNQEVFIPIK
ncbi:hypothetical protein C2E21_2482 [Chlorella sorokiniana]|uniref:Uncharacterized protein n=1 Tax=Chlorella sorokiniana TaxID=3076 RepID=A0A2P6TYK0_CHLSO|nr:hypothetical protein C2E21_2482 [Chlorella sorokiniana]|eukprot:PRW59120.1 hypothetical protein C2E21_2482 [Chlorella sorokiniana]